MWCFFRYRGKNAMYTTLPTSPIRTVKKCNKCPNFHVEFFNTKFNRTYTPEEWEQIVTEGREALDKALRLIREDPKFFS